MSQAATVISLDAGDRTNDILRGIIGTDREKIYEATVRLAGIEAVLFCLKNTTEDADCMLRPAMDALEQSVRDCIELMELRPLKGQRA